MPVPLSYPGVYIEELPSGVHTITGVATSITAFIGSAPRGQTDTPVNVQSFAEFSRTFGGLWVGSTVGYAVYDFFQNGGSQALIVRVAHSNAVPAKANVDTLPLIAQSAGLWGNKLQGTTEIFSAGPPIVFNLTIKDTGSGVSETFLNLSLDKTSPRYFVNVLADSSNLVVLDPAGTLPTTVAAKSAVVFGGGLDGDPIGDADISDAATLQAVKRGLWALDRAELFNLLCIPPFIDKNGDVEDIGDKTRIAATKYCEDRRAFHILDPLLAWTNQAAVLDATKGIAGTTWGQSPSANAALYFPMLLESDPLRNNQIGTFAACGAIAGVMARTDASRGVWKAPAGINATLVGALGLSVDLTDGENGNLNQKGVNCLRAFSTFGRVVWGARTTNGSDQLADQWKYVPVRRLALFLEESLYRGMQWVVFEPNDEPLWGQIRLNIGAFMQGLFRQGAFQGTSAKDAYFVKCDKETTTKNDIDLGVVNIVVGFAPVKPAEFVVLQIQQMAGQIQT